MKRFLLFLIFSACAVFKAYPCLNTYYVFDQEGTLYSMGGEWQYPFNKNFNLERNVTHLKKLEQKLKVEQNYMLLSDYAVCLMKLGKPKVALEILIELYKHYPSEYQIAANLGTAYELNARPDSALKYIKRDMELNPNDHEGSEWIHVKVLEAKLALQQNPDYLHDHSVLGLKQAQKKDSLLFKQLTIQLQERVPFTPVPDPILASLFTDLGDLSAAVRSVEYARAYYHIAKDYCGSQHPELDVKIKTMDKLINKYAAVPVPHRSMEETPTHVGFFRYTELLKDNDAGHYMINWDRLNTNVA
ncbi:MAG TPA: hypothetical protein VNZ86_16400, partial [Bacteroidia bacterium]|nr:hypothetical protein [Bacteroidia bacterium]